MIDRYSLSVSADKILKQSNYKASLKHIRSFNINPLQKASIFIEKDGIRHIRAVWGLLPHFSKELINRGNLFNASADGIASKPSYRIPIRQRRCLIPADSYYLFFDKQWYRVMRRDRSVLFFAGLYDEVCLDDDIYHSFSMVTVPPNRDLKELQKCMPVAMREDSFTDWLSPSAPLNTVLSLLKVSENYQWVYYPISKAIANDNYNAPDVHDEMQSEKTLFDLV